MEYRKFLYRLLGNFMSFLIEDSREKKLYLSEGSFFMVTFYNEKKKWEVKPKRLKCVWFYKKAAEIFPFFDGTVFLITD